jgi:hypothetical protein
MSGTKGQGAAMRMYFSILLKLGKGNNQLLDLLSLTVMVVEGIVHLPEIDVYLLSGGYEMELMKQTPNCEATYKLQSSRGSRRITLLLYIPWECCQASPLPATLG